MREGIRIRDFDWALLLIVLAICSLGVVEIYSATHNGQLAGMHMRQFWWVMIGLGCMLVVSRIDYHAILDQAPVLYILGLAGLVLVLAIGQVRFGHKSWLNFGGMNLQVSELVKLIIIVVLARFYSEVRTDRLNLLDIGKAGVLVGLPVGLILLQPDFGTAVMFLPIAAMGAFLSGIQWKHMVAFALIAALLLPVGWYALKPYQKERINTFLRPEENLRGAGYQTQQAKIAVGSGGFWGKGIGKGTQNQGGFIPVRWSDFILAALAEETGFIGVLVTLLLYMFLLLRLVQNAQWAKDRSGMYIVMGVAAVLGVHVFVNVGMMIGYVPVTGIPLPLMSYGGSSTLSVFMALGLVMNVRMRRFVN
ncbi:MAG: rod shape-determining protein RodA [Acidobacteria bacterium]|nr:rod shape-determining protein RodA [Acidobacteriota bacterium]MBI3483846.1 rod shape-determining protein RodA [Acidobacteriota bacterium]